MWIPSNSLMLIRPRIVLPIKPREISFISWNWSKSLTLTQNRGLLCDKKFQMKNLFRSILFAGLLFAHTSGFVYAQIPSSNSAGSLYLFTIEKEVKNTDVKNQNNSSTCWSFSSLSFLESEILKSGKPAVNLSEMFVVRMAYMQKAEKYVRMHGHTNLGPGGAFHDATNVIREYGIVPEEAYPGNPMAGNKHDHSELDAVLKGFLDVVVKNENRITDHWHQAVDGILDAYLGKIPASFDFMGKNYTPKGFAEYLGIKPDDYVEISSFTHQPMYKPFVLEVPDNWAWNTVYNVGLNELQEIADYSVSNNYSVAWAADVSEPGFSFKNSIALVPAKDYTYPGEMEKDSVFLKPTVEKVITPMLRQTSFDDYATQDDHGMHIVGTAKDQTGKRFYIVKNSWGSERNFAKGYFFCSAPYFLFKTTSLMVHKKGVPPAILTKLKL